MQQEGTVDHTPVYVREVVKRALELSATAIVLVHNHPSGDPTPSRADIDMTKQIVAAAAAMGIAVHDHIIVGRDRATPASSRCTLFEPSNRRGSAPGRTRPRRIGPPRRRSATPHVTEHLPNRCEVGAELERGRMCGIAGIIDLTGKRQPDPAAVQRMARALIHRGPDDEGYLIRRGLGLASRRLSIVGLGDGHQPIFNEDGSVAVVFNGELFDYPERKAELEAKGHVFRTHTDTELIVHMYEEYGEGVFAELKGQFAHRAGRLRQGARSILARDRVGICPLHWSQQGDWLYFGSEIKALLASGERAGGDRPARARPHLHVLRHGHAPHHVRRRAVAAARPLSQDRLPPRQPARARSPSTATGTSTFPTPARRTIPRDSRKLIDEFEATFRRAVEIRLRADVPVVSYLSGGVNSAYVLATASLLRGKPLPTFTIQVPGKGLDETDDALVTARHVGSRPTILTSDCSAHRQHLRAPHRGDGLPGHRHVLRGAVVPRPGGAPSGLQGRADRRRLGRGVRRLHLVQAARADLLDGRRRRQRQRLDQPRHPPAHVAARQQRRDLKRIDDMVGRAHAQALMYHLVSSSRDRYFSAALKEQLGSFVAYEDVPLDLERMRRWAPLNQSLYFGYKVHLPGLLLNHKGDRVAMANSVETRYPFLDEDFIAMTSRLAPRWKLRGFTKDKYILRQAAARILPKEVAFRKKGMFRAPLAESFFINPPPFVRQLMSPESLRRAGYFDVQTVRHDYGLVNAGPGRQAQRVPQDGLERRARDPALAPHPIRRPVRAPRDVAAPAGRAPAPPARSGVSA